MLFNIHVTTGFGIRLRLKSSQEIQLSFYPPSPPKKTTTTKQNKNKQQHLNKCVTSGLKGIRCRHLRTKTP